LKSCAAITILKGTLGHEFVGDVVGVADARDKDWIGRAVVEKSISRALGLGFRHPGQRKDVRYCRRGIQRTAPAPCAGNSGHDGAFAEFLALPVVNSAPRAQRHPR